MPDRADVTAILLAVVGSILAAVSSIFIPDAFGSNGSPVAVLVFVTITIPIYAYGAYWAFSVRHALAVRLYRNQAFGIGVIVLAFWSTIGIYGALSGILSLQIFTAISTLTWYFLFVTIFYWIDASVLAARRSDPLLRDTLHWSKLRIPLWIIDLVAIGVTFSVLGYSEITGNASLLNQLNTGFSNGILNIINSLPVVLTLVCGIIFLSAIAVRAKWDRTLRKHFSWFAIFLLLSFGIIGNILSFIGPISFIVAGFALYKSAKSLVPLNQIPRQESIPELMTK